LQEDKDKVANSVAFFISVFEKEAKNYKGSATGWVEEDIDIPGTDEKGKAFVLLVGWTSVEAHQEFANTQAFKDNIHHIMGVKDMKKIEAVHTSFKEVTGKRKSVIAL
jgi:heme-degrading monooxygenase HmoA